MHQDGILVTNGEADLLVQVLWDLDPFFLSDLANVNQGSAGGALVKLVGNHGILIQGAVVMMLSGVDHQERLAACSEVVGTVPHKGQTCHHLLEPRDNHWVVEEIPCEPSFSAHT